jgi:hypothetical protein
MGDQTEKNRMDSIYIMDKVDEKWVDNLNWKKCKATSYLEDLGLDFRIILKINHNKLGLSVALCKYGKQI